MKITAGQFRHSGGFTMIEAVMSLLIVSIMLVAALQSTGASGLTQYKSARQVTARLLADGLMNEILALHYEDPDTTPICGLESGESSGVRSTWDDVDDYCGLNDNPGERNGIALPNLPGWKWIVVADRIDPSAPSQVVANDTGAKRITVTIKHHGATVLTRQAIRTRAR